MGRVANDMAGINIEQSMDYFMFLITAREIVSQGTESCCFAIDFWCSLL